MDLSFISLICLFQQLDTASGETDQWLNGWSELSFWLDEAGIRHAGGGGDAQDGQAVKKHLEEAKVRGDWGVGN